MLPKEEFVCQCYSPEHRLIFWYDEDEKQHHVMVHLNPERNFFKRVWKAITYILGYRSRTGDYDDFLLDNEDKERLKEFLNNE